MRRANDITQVDKLHSGAGGGQVTSDTQFGTHHAQDAHRLFETLDQDLNLFSSAVKLNTQYMHSIWFYLALEPYTSIDEVMQRLEDNPRVA